MTTFYISTRSTYVLVAAESAQDALSEGISLLSDMLNQDASRFTLTVRPATQQELDLQRFFEAETI